MKNIPLACAISQSTAVEARSQEFVRQVLVNLNHEAAAPRENTHFGVLPFHSTFSTLV
jgi:hypothetical protein